MGPPKCWAPGNCPVCPPLEPALPLRCLYPYLTEHNNTNNNNNKNNNNNNNNNMLVLFHT